MGICKPWWKKRKGRKRKNTQKKYKGNKETKHQKGMIQDKSQTLCFILIKDLYKVVVNWIINE